MTTTLESTPKTKAQSKRDLCQFMVGTDICGHDLSGHRPYAYKRDGIPSSSGLAGLIDGGKSGSFAWVAATIGARYAVHTDLSAFSTADCDHESKSYCDRCRYIRGRFDAEWGAKADLGTHVHHIALSSALGETHLSDPHSEPYVDALYQFYEDYKPVWTHNECTVEYDVEGHEYRGQFDAIGDMTVDGEPRRVLLDYKSGGVHLPEMSAQLTSYRYATWMTTWQDKQVIAREPMPPVDMTAVLMLADDGTYRFIEVDSTPADFDTFLKLRELWAWHRDQTAKQKDIEKAEVAA